ncbi:MAG TPA: alpha/beta hydrolase [Gemmataceae bacterium]|jgi:pimeloyl-ACP methyl ester carboxylesterase|nr:alpha/beta hydrolase [Gemmataceae bacterium]
MRISAEWAQKKKDIFDPDICRTARAHLRHYTATFREWGEGPPLVVIPGLAGGIDLLAPLARALSSHYRVIAYQLRGEEDCFALRRRFGMRDLVEDLAEFVEWLGLEQPDILGLSFGGVIGLQYAAAFPYRLRSLSVQGVGARLEKSLLKFVAGLVLKDYPLPTNSQFVNQFFQMLFGRGPQPKEIMDFVTRHCWQTDQSVMTHRFHLIRKIDLRPCLKDIRNPVLVMSGLRDVFISNHSLLELCEGIEDVQFVRLPKGGHLAFLIDPERVVQEVTGFTHRFD